MAMFDMYRSGFRRGTNDGRASKFRRPAWFLIATNAWLWLPLLADRHSYVKGYQDGFSSALMAEEWRVLALNKHE